jgi:hypothetical protein
MIDRSLEGNLCPLDFLQRASLPGIMHTFLLYFHIHVPSPPLIVLHRPVPHSPSPPFRPSVIRSSPDYVPDLERLVIVRYEEAGDTRGEGRTSDTDGIVDGSARGVRQLIAPAPPPSSAAAL